MDYVPSYYNPSVAVIIPTIGKQELRKAIESVEAQTYPCKPYLFVDGVNNWNAIQEIGDHPTSFLHQNIGSGGFYGHRIYAASPHLVNEDVIFFLDEDNWYQPDHVERGVKRLAVNSWAFSWRNIYTKTGEFVCRDECESLGIYPVWNKDHFHVDTSSYCFRREFLIQYSWLWHFGWGADRRFFKAISVDKDISASCTKSFTLNYRLEGNENSVKPEFFLQGNQIMKEAGYKFQ